MASPPSCSLSRRGSLAVEPPVLSRERHDGGRVPALAGAQAPTNLLFSLDHLLMKREKEGDREGEDRKVSDGQGVDRVPGRFLVVDLLVNGLEGAPGLQAPGSQALISTGHYLSTLLTLFRSVSPSFAFSLVTHKKRRQRWKVRRRVGRSCDRRVVSSPVGDSWKVR